MLATLPDVEFKVIADITVNNPDPEFVPSVTETVCSPATELGTLNDVEKEPVESDDGVATIVPSYFIVIVVDPTVPFPVTKTELPTAPVVGLIVAVGTTANISAPSLDDASVAVMMYVPVSDAGIVNEAEKEPVELLVTVEGFVVTVVPLYFIVIVDEPVYPCPVIVTELPTAPDRVLELIDVITV